jgi:hypothetical protein
MYKLILVERPSCQLLSFLWVLGCPKYIYVVFALPKFVLCIVKPEIGIAIDYRWWNCIPDIIGQSVTFLLIPWYPFASVDCGLTVLTKHRASDILRYLALGRKTKIRFRRILVWFASV